MSSTTDSLLHSCSLTVYLTQNPFQPVTDQQTPHTGSLIAVLKNPHRLQQDRPSSRGDLHHNHRTQTTEASPLTPHTTSQQAELIALTRALTLAKNLRVNIHTDFKYAYNILHSNILTWRERGFPTQKGSPIFNSELIHKLLEAALLPKSCHPPLCCCCCVTAVMSDSAWPHRWQPTKLPVPGILQARPLEGVAISFSSAWDIKREVSYQPTIVLQTRRQRR